MIKNILWDFDGVIFDGMRIKAEGFREIFSEYPQEKIDEFVRYHYLHGGVPRFDKIRYFFEKILRIPPADEDIGLMAERFGEIMKERLFDKTFLIGESVDFIEKNYDRYRFHIVSGAEHDELNRLCGFLGLSGYFVTIEGSPTAKEILIRGIMGRYGYAEDETLMIGDSVTDLDAAAANGIGFCGYNNESLRGQGRCYLDSFGSL